LGITWLPSLLFLYPLALIRKKSKTGLFFFFDRYAMGGAQRIHIDILKTVQDTQKEVYFTRLSPNSLFKDEFYSLPNTNLKDIHFWCDNLLFRLFSVHYFSFYINRHPSGRLFGSNSTFFYDMLPFISRRIIKMELLHNFTFGKKGMEFFGLMNCRLLDLRIVYDDYTRENIKKQYTDKQVNPAMLKRLLFIEPGVDIPESVKKNLTLPLKIISAGRGGIQKRIWLINKVAEYFIDRGEAVEFHFAGNLISELTLKVTQRSVIHGEISDPEKMKEIQAQCAVALLTSSYEGFPMFIKEAMANGCIPVVTALPGNLTHLKNGVNCLLIDAIENEEEVIMQAIEKIQSLVSDQPLRQRLSSAAYEYAKSHFTRQAFTTAYRTILLSER
jgi:glycosyltransferase involved in cell wall biosynthesis